MKIVFGLDLDGYQAMTRRDSFGELVCGPLRLLEVLELRLGLSARAPSLASRIAKYRELLERAVASRPQFYSESFSKDAFAVAETLLRWRDELVLAGWDGSPDPGDSLRINDLAEVERMDVANLLPGFGDRIRRILSGLGHRDPRLDLVTVLDNPDDLPRLVHDLLRKLGASFGQHERWVPFADSSSDLRKVQDRLTIGDTGNGSALSNDGSILFATAYSEVTLAQFAAQLIQKNRRDEHSMTIVARGDCACLDSALRAVDEPVVGSSVYSAQRPVLQTLALALRLRWQPLDPRHLLEFLVHPVSPMDDRLRWKLAEVVAGYPGIGGDPWNQAVERQRSFIHERFGSEPAILRKMLSRVDDDLSKWIMVERFDPRSGAPGTDLASTCLSVAQWAVAVSEGKDLTDAIARQFSSLASLASDLAAILRTLPVVTRVQLERLIDMVIGNGMDSGDAQPEAGHIHRIITPGALMEPVDAVIWWDFRNPDFSPRIPWSDRERDQLKLRGIELQSVASRVAHANRMFMIPVLTAKKQLVFLIPRRSGNEPTGHHPLFDRIQSIVGGKLPIFDLDRHVADPAQIPIPPQIRPALNPSLHRPLPRIRRWWKLDNSRHLGPKESESFTSAEKFIFSPYYWVLYYKAKIRPGVLFKNRIINDARQNGNLLHRLIQRLFTHGASIDWLSCSPSDIQSWIESQWEKLLPAEASNLLLPGNRAPADRLLTEAKRAIWALIQHLRAASVVKTAVDLSPPHAQFFEGAIHGYIDLLVENSHGGKGIIDMKYSGLKTRKEALANNRQLQLAVYGYLIAQAGSWPDSAFFILRDRALLAQTNRFFSDAIIVPPKSDEIGLETCWNEFTTVWAARRTLLDHGWIELTIATANTADGTAPDSNALSPIARWRAPEDADRFNQFEVLTGWEENA